LQGTSAEAPNQVLTIDAPAKLSPEDVLSDAVLARAATGGTGVSIPQLELLLGADPIAALAPDGQKPLRLKDETLKYVINEGANKSDDKAPERTLAGELCHRVEVKTPQGPAVFWIHPEKHALMRFEFPMGDLKKKLDPDGVASKVNMWADFVGARLNENIADHAFEFSAPGGVLVKRLILPPQPIDPRIGEKLADFTLVDLSGAKVEANSLTDKIIVADFWDTGCRPCFEGFKTLEGIYQRYKSNDRVVFLAVDLDDPQTSNAKVQAALDNAGVHLPVVRDPQLHARDIFLVQSLPNLFLLANGASIQDHWEGLHDDLAATLPRKIDALLAGENLAQAARKKYTEEEQQFRRELAEVTVGTTATVELPQTKIAEASEPSNLKLTKLWTAENVKEPGNLITVDGGENSSRMFVIDGWRTVVEVDAAGKTVARHELPIPVDEAVGTLRTGVDNQSQRSFAAFAVGLKKVFLFDDQWKLSLGYPEGDHAGLSDVQLADLDGSGQLNMLIGYFGTVGVQYVAADGKRLWSNRSLENVYRIAVINGESDQRKAVCTHAGGSLVTFDAQGKSVGEWRIPNRLLHTIVSANVAPGKPMTLCGLSATDVGLTTAIGVDLEGKETWNYPLPDGVHSRPIETVVAGRLNAGELSWLFPGVDGSVHILDAGGKLIDKFNTGETLTGLAAGIIEGQPALLISTVNGLTGYRVEMEK
jgi:thiol-disulfide isomerase/thioredoxin